MECWLQKLTPNKITNSFRLKTEFILFNTKISVNPLMMSHHKMKKCKKMKRALKPKSVLFLVIETTKVTGETAQHRLVMSSPTV